MAALLPKTLHIQSTGLLLDFIKCLLICLLVDVAYFIPL